MAAFVLEHGRLWSVGVRGYAMIPDGLPLDEGVIGRAVRTSAAQLVLDVSEDPDFVEVSRATVSELSAPLLMPTGVVGVLNIETSVALPAGSATAVAELLAVLAEPMDELRGSRTDLSSLARLFVYMSSLRDPQAIAEVTVRSLGRVLPIETSQLLLLDDDGQLVESTEWSATAQAPEPLPLASLRALRSAHRRVGRLRVARHDRGGDPRAHGPEAPIGGADSAARERRRDRPARRLQPLRTRVRPWPGGACIAPRRACGGVARRGGGARPRAPQRTHRSAHGSLQPAWAGGSPRPRARWCPAERSS